MDWKIKKSPFTQTQALTLKKNANVHDDSKYPNMGGYNGIAS